MPGVLLVLVRMHIFFLLLVTRYSCTPPYVKMTMDAKRSLAPFYESYGFLMVEMCKMVYRSDTLSAIVEPSCSPGIWRLWGIWRQTLGAIKVHNAKYSDVSHRFFLHNKIRLMSRESLK